MAGFCFVDAPPIPRHPAHFTQENIGFHIPLLSYFHIYLRRKIGFRLANIAAAMFCRHFHILGKYENRSFAWFVFKHRCRVLTPRSNPF